jgi:uncharacterized protein YndB with AHSA1/START domain
VTVATDTKQVEDLVVFITRVFDAPRELVFEVVTDPKHMVRF